MVVETLTANWELIIGLLAVGLLAYWWFDERGDSNSAADTVERVGGRAEVATGGVVGAFGSLVAVLASIALTIGTEISQAGMMVNEVLGGFSALAGHFVFAIVTFLGVGGYVPISVQQLGFVFVVVTIVVLLNRRGGD